MAKINSRTKGATGERELCDWLFENFQLSEKPTRNLDQVRDSGADVICNPFAFEVKRRETLDYISWWGQIKRAVENKNGKAFGLEPVVAFRQNGYKWQFMISARHLGILDGWIVLSERVFKIWALRFVENHKLNQQRLRELTSGNTPFLIVGAQ